MTISSLEDTLLGITREKKDTEMKFNKMKSVVKGILVFNTSCMLCLTTMVVFFNFENNFC